MKSFNLLRNSFAAEAKPSLRERAANLRASAARLMGRKPDPAETDQGRRMMVAGSMAAAVAAPLPVLAMSALSAEAPGAHPDQALFDAEATYNAAVLAERSAEHAHGEAYRAYKRALGDLPDALIFPEWAAIATAHPGMPLGQHCIKRKMDSVGDRIVYRWTADGLRTAIAALPKAFGPAGTTPKLIRALRELVPIAEAYEARIAAAEALSGLPATRAPAEETRAARCFAESVLNEAVAVTAAGLAVKVRYAVQSDRRTAGGPWGPLMRSAAAVSGVALIEPESDAAGWLSAWEAIGGRVMPTPLGQPIDVIAPRANSAADAAEERRLFTDFVRHRDAITRYVRGRA